MNLQKAIEYYKVALRVRTEEEFPLDWARTQYNLGLAYGNLPTGDRAKNLQRAIKCYDAALRIYTEQEFPQDCAMTQNSLGLAYRNLPTGGSEANLQQAIECYNAALRVYTQQEFPQEWAMMQNNLGLAYRKLPTGDRGENLQKAFECYNAVLQIYTEQEFPQKWATTLADIAFVEWTIAVAWETHWAQRGWGRDKMWSSAEKRLECAIATCRSIGHEHQTQQHVEALATLRSYRDRFRDEDAAGGESS